MPKHPPTRKPSGSEDIFGDGSTLDALAQAYAETGDFPLALSTQERALAGINETKKRTPVSESDIAAARVRLELYGAGQPYRYKQVAAAKKAAEKADD